MRTLPVDGDLNLGADLPPTRPGDHRPVAPTRPRPARAASPGSALLAVPQTARVAHASWSGDPAVLVPSPPGSGKTRLVVMLAAMLAHRGDLHVGIAAQTREQAVQIARRLAAITDRAGLVWAARAAKPDGVQVLGGTKIGFPTGHGGIRVATTARWLFMRPWTQTCDVMVVDEAWQCTYADLGALGAFSGQVVCVGDPGQIAPVVTGRTSRWDHDPAGPHLSAPEALAANLGADATTVALPHTWRLGPQTTALVQPTFYPGLDFGSRRPPEQVAVGGRNQPEVAAHAVTGSGPTDPAFIDACAARARDLIGGALTTGDGTRDLSAADVAVVCAHVSQAAAVRAHLADHPDVLVGTANQLQGLERHAVVALHPLAGYREVGPFTADLGRACVMFSRHRAHLSVVTDDHTLDVLASADPGAAGVGVHRTLIEWLTTTT